MKKSDAYTCTEACEDLRIARMSLDAGSCHIAFELLESLAYYVASDHARSSVEADRLKQLAQEVEGPWRSSHPQAKNACGKSLVSCWTCSDPNIES